MMPLDLPPKLWLPPKPAIIRAWKREELKRAPLVQASFLPGMFPAGAAAAGGLRTLTQVLSATDSDGAAFTLPVGIEAGDLIVVFDFARGFGVPTTVIPSGFTEAINVDDGSLQRNILSYKIADGTEGGTSVNGMNAISEGKCTYVFRGNVPITAALPTDPAEELADTNPTAQTVNASGGVVPLVVIGCYACSSSSVNPRTFTVGGSAAKDGEIQAIHAGGDMYLAYKIYNSSPADVVIDMDDEGDGNCLMSCYFACA